LVDLRRQILKGQALQQQRDWRWPHREIATCVWCGLPGGERPPPPGLTAAEYAAYEALALHEWAYKRSSGLPGAVVFALWNVVLVEGYTDVLRAHLAGFTNVVGLMGLAYTPYHQHLVRPIKRKVLFLDKDDRGNEAVIRLATTQPDVDLLNADMLFVPGLDPQPADPDEIISQVPDYFAGAIKDARPFLESVAYLIVIEAQFKASAAIERVAREIAVASDQVLKASPPAVTVQLPDVEMETKITALCANYPTLIRQHF
jgi:hypothetical protein